MFVRSQVKTDNKKLQYRNIVWQACSQSDPHHFGSARGRDLCDTFIAPEPKQRIFKTRVLLWTECWQYTWEKLLSPSYPIFRLFLSQNHPFKILPDIVDYQRLCKYCTEHLIPIKK